MLVKFDIGGHTVKVVRRFYVYRLAETPTFHEAQFRLKISQKWLIIQTDFM
jgi:hypothetical protein